MTDHRLLVALSNPRTERGLISLASILAAATGGIVHAIHVVQVPDQTSLRQGSEQLDRIETGSETLLEAAREDAATFGVPLETTTVVSHDSLEEVFGTARRHDADTVIMGWSESPPWAAGRAESAIGELTDEVPCDVLILDDHGFDPSRVLVPTAGGPDSDLSAATARRLRARAGSAVSLLYVVNGDSEKDDGERFLADWAANHDLDDANRIVDASGDVEGAIARAAEDHTLVIVGATERGLLDRLLGRSLSYDIVADLDCSLVLAERPSPRSLREWISGRR